jgi:hypothetical protein
MSRCEKCGIDSIYGLKKRHTVLLWLCTQCRDQMLGIPAPIEFHRRWDILPPTAIAAITAIVISVILAIGAHW